MLLCYMKYKEPGSAKHDAQKALGEASEIWRGEHLLSVMVLQHMY